MSSTGTYAAILGPRLLNGKSRPADGETLEPRFNGNVVDDVGTNSVACLMIRCDESLTLRRLIFLVDVDGDLDKSDGGGRFAAFDFSSSCRGVICNSYC